MRKNVRRALFVTLYGVIAPLVAFTAVMGFAHTKAGHPLLVKLMPLLKKAGVPGTSCPLGYDVAMTPAQKEQARQAFAASHRGTASVIHRPALGFVLDQTTSRDVLAWAHEKGVTCKRPQTGYDLDCSHVPESALPSGLPGTQAVTSGGSEATGEISSLWLTFGEGDRLISLVAIRRDANAQGIAQSFGTLNEELTQLDGPAAVTSGTPTPEFLSQGAFRQASAEYRFQNYYVMTRATNMGRDYLMSEEYRSL